MRKRLRSTFYFLEKHLFLMHLLERNFTFKWFPWSKSGNCEGSDAWFSNFKSSGKQFPPQYLGVDCTKKHVFSDLGTSENSAISGSPEGLAGGRSYFLEQIFFHDKSTKMNLQGIRWPKIWNSQVFFFENQEKIVPGGCKDWGPIWGGVCYFFPSDFRCFERLRRGRDDGRSGVTCNHSKP